MNTKTFRYFLALLAVAVAVLLGYVFLVPSEQSTDKSEHSEATRLTVRKPYTVKDIASARDAQLKGQPSRRVKKKRNRSQIPDDISG